MPIQGIPLTNEGTGICKCKRGCKYGITHNSFQSLTDLKTVKTIY